MSSSGITERESTEAIEVVSGKGLLPVDFWPRVWKELPNEDREKLEDTYRVTEDNFVEMGTRIDSMQAKFNRFGMDSEDEVSDAIIERLPESILTEMEEKMEEVSLDESRSTEVENPRREALLLMLKKPFKHLKAAGEFCGQSLTLAGGALAVVTASSAGAIATAGAAVPVVIGCLVLVVELVKSYRKAREFCDTAVSDFVEETYKCACNVLSTLRLLLVFPYGPIEKALRNGKRGIFPVLQDALTLVCKTLAAEPESARPNAFANQLVRTLKTPDGKQASKAMKEERIRFAENLLPIHTQVLLRYKLDLGEKVVVDLSTFQPPHVGELEDQLKSVREQVKDKELRSFKYFATREELRQVRDNLETLKRQVGDHSEPLKLLKARMETLQGRVDGLSVPELKQELREINQDLNNMKEEMDQKLKKMKEESDGLGEAVQQMRGEVETLKEEGRQKLTHCEAEQQYAIKRRRVPDEAEGVLLHFDDDQRPESRLEKGLLDRSPHRRRAWGVSGMAGVGKTSICIAVAKRESVMQAFERVVWLSYGPSIPKQDAARCMQDLVKMMWRPGEPSPPESEWLEGLKGPVKTSLQGRRVLVVLDDVWQWSHVGDLVEAITDVAGESSVLLSTRNKELLEAAGKEVEIEEIEELSEVDAIAVLKKRIEESVQWEASDEEKAKAMLEVVGKLPLLVSSVGAMVGARKKDWEGLLAELQESKRNPFEKFITPGLTPEDDAIGRRKSILITVAPGPLMHLGP